MFAVIAAILFGVGFFLELMNQSQHYVWLFMLGGLLSLAIALAVGGGPVFTIRHRS